MTISEIYLAYKLMPNLQLHQLRVAAVAKTVAENTTASSQEVIHITKAALLHDMGNIIKFDLQRFPAFLEPEGYEYWQSVQQEYFETYGKDEHRASLAIAAELKQAAQVVQLIDAVGFNSSNHLTAPLSTQIVEYADMRVAPSGIVSMDERLHDLFKRYAHRYPGEEAEKERASFVQAMLQIEQTLFKNASKTPFDLTEDSLRATIEDLKSFDFPEVSGQVGL